jgi:hypothetical protein
VTFRSEYDSPYENTSEFTPPLSCYVDSAPSPYLIPTGLSYNLESYHESYVKADSTPRDWWGLSPLVTYVSRMVIYIQKITPTFVCTRLNVRRTIHPFHSPEWISESALPDHTCAIRAHDECVVACEPPCWLRISVAHTGYIKGVAGICIYCNYRCPEKLNGVLTSIIPRGLSLQYVCAGRCSEVLSAYH